MQNGLLPASNGRVSDTALLLLDSPFRCSKKEMHDNKRKT